MSERIFSFVKPANWGCGPTAVRAITGASVEDVEAALRPVLERASRDPNQMMAMLPRHVAAAIIALGFDLYDQRPRKPNPFRDRNINTPLVNADDWMTFPTIKEFVARNTCEDLVMGIASQIESGSETHTFVVDGHRFFDSNTNGEIVPPDGVPQCLDGFRVLNWYRVRPRSG